MSAAAEGGGGVRVAIFEKVALKNENGWFEAREEGKEVRAFAS